MSRNVTERLEAECMATTLTTLSAGGKTVVTILCKNKKTGLVKNQHFPSP